MSTINSGEGVDDYAAVRTIRDCLDSISVLKPLTTQPIPVANRSYLQVVDKRCPQAETSTTVWHSIAGAIEHTIGVALLVGEPSEDEIWWPGCSPSAIYAAIRVPQLAASRALWILRAESADKSANRALETRYSEQRFMLQVLEDITESTDRMNAYSVYDLDAQNLYDRVRSGREELEGLRDLLRTRVPGWRKPTSETEIVETAARYRTDYRPDAIGQHAYLMAWRVGSGAAHGYQWPSLIRGLQLLDASEHRPNAPTVGDMHAVSLAFQATIALLLKATTSFRRYAQAQR